MRTLFEIKEDINSCDWDEDPKRATRDLLKLLREALKVFYHPRNMVTDRELRAFSAAFGRLRTAIEHGRWYGIETIADGMLDGLECNHLYDLPPTILTRMQNLSLDDFLNLLSNLERWADAK